MEKVKKGQQIRELPMCRRLLTLALAVVGWLLGLVVCVALLVHLNAGLESLVHRLVITKDKMTVNETSKARNADGKITSCCFLCRCSTSIIVGSGWSLSEIVNERSLEMIKAMHSEHPPSTFCKQTNDSYLSDRLCSIGRSDRRLYSSLPINQPLSA